MNEMLKKLTGKNPKDFEPVAYSIINNSDEKLFSELVASDDFLFDFVKQNVSKRLAGVCNKDNYLNLINFLKYYSPYYEEFIISTLVSYADDDLTDKMLEIFENGTEDEKTYCAKFFSYIQDPLSLEFLKRYAWSENSYLSSNCASTLALFKDMEVYSQAQSKLLSDDEFIKLEGVKYLCAYGDKNAVNDIISTMKKSSMAENIAGELLYLIDWFEIYNTDKSDALFVLNSLINGLGEILSLGVVFDFELYNVFEMLIKENKTSEIAVVLLNAIEKFDTLTENDEYLFDETKDTKQEVNDIKQLLNSINKAELLKLSNQELKPDSLLVFTALEFGTDYSKIRELLTSSNPAIVVKSLETLKNAGEMVEIDRQKALETITDDNLKNVILAI